MSIHIWKTLQQDIERFYTQTQNNLVYDKIWDMYEEGLFLKQSLDQLSSTTEEEIAPIVDSLVRGQHHLQNYLLESAQNNKEEFQIWLDKRISKLEEKTRQITGDVVHRRITLATELQSMAHELFFLKRLARRIYENSENILPDILNEIHYLVMQSHDGDSIFDDQIVEKELATLRTQAVKTEVDKFAEKSKENMLLYQEKKMDLIVLWASLRWGGEIHPQISRTLLEHKDILSNCVVQCDAIKKNIEEGIATLEKKERWNFIEQVLLDAQDMIDDVLVSVQEKSLRVTTKALEIVSLDIQWLTKTVKVYLNDEPPLSLKKQYKKYLSRCKFFRGQVQDTNIQYRMENLFGRKFVRFFDRFILWLIIAVIALLIVEEVGDFSTKTKQIFTYVDAGFCAIFLFEFFTKLFLADGKWLYFKRSWFTEFLPSIPFGILSQLPQLNKIHFLRGVRLVRVLRMVRVFRVITFLIRGTDRFVRSYGRWLNRNIVFFGENAHSLQKSKLSIPERVNTLRNVCLNRARSIFNKINNDNERIPFIIMYIKTLEIQMEENIAGDLEKEQVGASSDILVENVIQDMLYITGEKVEESMGYEFPSKVYTYFRFFNIPLLRSMPIIKNVVQKHRESDAMEFTAWMGRSIGRFIQRGLATIYWFVDLYGVLSPPRVLDRIGNAMVETFKRPAIRLLVAGGFILILKLLFMTWQWPFLGGLVDFLNKFLGTPLLVIGGLCSIPLIAGLWLRNIAGEATEFYMRTAEAQFINLLEDIKLQNSKRDIQIIYERVMGPELQILKGSVSGEYGEKWLITQWQDSIELGACIESDTCNVTTVKQARLWNRQRPVFLLYRDYLDGAPLHRSDVKTTEQLLGNIAIENIRKHRLEYRKSEYKAMDKLDLENSKSIFGPYLWFAFITQSISHNVASLLVEYNKNAIPESLLELQDSKKLNNYSRWLSWRLQDEWNNSKSKNEIEIIQKNVKEKETKRINMKKKKKRQKKNDSPIYTTTRFNALHFLSISQEQDQSIRLTFGEDIYKAFTKDRKENIRHIFGTYPLYLLPATQRKINPYNMYQNYMSGGKVFTLPFKLILMAIKIIGLTIKWMYQKVREILNPEIQTEPPKIKADFNVVIRKINRMRKPVFIECMKLRARFDFEYLGIESVDFPGLSNDEKYFKDEFLQKKEDFNWIGLFEKDLEFITALDSEKDYFYELRRSRKERLQSFSKFLHQRGWDGDKFKAYLNTIGNNWGSRCNEVLRALAIAYSIGYKKLPSLLSATEVLENAFDQAIEHLGYNKGDRFHRKLTRIAYRTLKTAGSLVKDRDYKDFQIFWSQSKFANSSAKHKRWCWNTYLVNRSQLKDALYFLTESGDVSVAENIIQNIIRNPTPWTEELLAIRTVQTLSVLDVLNYRGHVAILGEYPDKEIYM